MFRVFAALLLLSSACAWADDYPDTGRGDVVDQYHGTAVADPYRWLEDVDSAQTQAWVAAQNRVSRQLLDDLPGRDALRERLTAVWNYEKFGVPERVGEYYYYRYNDGLRNQAMLVRQQGMVGARETVLDPNTLSADGTTALTTWQLSPNGRYLAYGVAEAGSDWNRFFVRDLSTGENFPEVLDRIKFSDSSWTHDSAGFFYSRYPQRDGVFDELSDQALYYHRIGSPQSDDIPVLARPDQPKWGFAGEVSSDGRYLLISIWQGADEENALYLRRLASAQDPRVRGRLLRLVDDFKASYIPLGNIGSTLYLLSSRDAPRRRILSIDLDRPRGFTEVLAQGEDTIEFARLVGGRLAVVAMQDAVHRLRLYGLDGVLQREIALPGIGSVTGLRGEPDQDELLLGFETYLAPDQQLRIAVASGQVQPINTASLPFAAEQYVTEQRFYPSADGTQVPLFLTYRRGLDLSQPRPTYLYGYGGFSISLTPNFRPDVLPWLERGGVYAVANLRGGGEYGEAWHRAGMRENKQRVFDDFIAAAQYLIDQDITAAEKLAIAGGSNGGLLVGAVMNQRPELFAAGLPAVGVMDMLRFHQFTIGWAWVGEYGSSADAQMFPVLRAYSPYHNIAAGKTYPAVLVTTADHDDRVVPGHSFKYAAALQHADTGPAPTLISIETRAGHGAGTPTSKRIDQAVDRYAFIAAHTGMRLGSQVPWQRLGAVPE